MLDPENVCYASIASFWEIGIKSSLGRIELHDGLNNVFDLIWQSGFIHFPIKKDHIIQSAHLPFHHRDPFDRLLIGQSISENLTMLTKDRAFHQYPVTVVWD